MPSSRVSHRYGIRFAALLMFLMTYAISAFADEVLPADRQATQHVIEQQIGAQRTAKPACINEFSD